MQPSASLRLWHLHVSSEYSDLKKTLFHSNYTYALPPSNSWLNSGNDFFNYYQKIHIWLQCILGIMSPDSNVLVPSWSKVHQGLSAERLWVRRMFGLSLISISSFLFENGLFIFHDSRCLDSKMMFEIRVLVPNGNQLALINRVKPTHRLSFINCIIIVISNSSNLFNFL